MRTSHRQIKGAVVFAIVGCLALVIAPSAAMAARSSTEGRVELFSCTGSWQLQQSPHPAGSSLTGVAALGLTDVWAVGYANGQHGQQTLIEHWDGSAWSLVSTPDLPTSSQLGGVAAVSPSDVWAVGAQDVLGQTLIEHWDGASWVVVPSPSPGTTLNRLNAVEAIAADDVWAVGLFTSSLGGELPLAEHWDGSAWSAVDTAPLPPNDGVATFLGVSGTGPADVWAVGDYGNTQGEITTLAEHWDGATWSIVLTPSPTVNAQLFGISAVSADRAFAVGEAGLYPSDKVLALRRDGATWHSMPAGNPAAPNDLFSVSVPATGPAWSVGSSGGDSVLIERATRNGWKVATAPSLPGSESLKGVSTLDGGAAWAVGEYDPPSGQSQTLIESVC